MVKRKTEDQDMWKGSKKKKQNSLAGIDSDAVLAIFNEIADADDPSQAGMEGIFAMGEKLGIDATEDVRILVLLWKMGCKEKPGTITREEFLSGMAQFEVESWDGLKEQLPACEIGFLDHQDYKDFFKFTFNFNRHGTHRTLDKELVIALLKLVLPPERVPERRLDAYCTFLDKAEGYSRITLDQWTSFLDFCHEVEDLASYDESTSAWPVLIDDFVEYLAEADKK